MENNNFFSKFEAVSKVFLPLVLALIGWKTNETAKALDQDKYEQSVSEFKTNSQLKYLDYFLKNIDQRDSIHQNIAIQLLPKIEPELAKAYSNLLKKDIPIKDEKKLEQISNSIEDFGELNQYKIGIYCSTTGKSFAEEIQQKLLKSGFKGFVTVNVRDQNFFSQVSPPETNEVRFEPNIEDNVANNLKDILKKEFPNIDFETKPVSNRTPNFLSIMLK